LKKDGFLESLNYAIEGIVNALRTQRSMKIHFIIAILVMLFSLIMGVNRLELIFIFLIICCIMALEMINTALEIVVDMLAQEYSIKAKLAKNTAAGAVLIAVIGGVFGGYLIFADRIGSFSFQFAAAISRKPLHLVFINLGLLLLIIIFWKSFYKRGKPLEGGMPSGHSALAFSVAVMVYFLSTSNIVISLVFILAVLTAHSRVDSGVHSLKEVIAGSVLGIILSVLIFVLF